MGLYGSIISFSYTLGGNFGPSKWGIGYDPVGWFEKLTTEEKKSILQEYMKKKGL